MNGLDIEEIEKRLQELKDLPSFKPDPHEMRYTVKQLFETGIEASISFVIRNGQKIFYKPE